MLARPTGAKLPRCTLTAGLQSLLVGARNATPTIRTTSRYTSGQRYAPVRARCRRCRVMSGSRHGGTGARATSLALTVSAAFRRSVQYPPRMARPLRSSICPLAAMAVLVVSGCGSAKKTSTNETASTNATTSAPANATGQSKSSKPAQHATKARKPPVAEAKPQPKEKATRVPPESREKEQAEIRAAVRRAAVRRRAASTPSLEAAELELPLERRLPKQVQGKFMLACRAAKGSTSSCECIIVRQELDTKVEVGQLLAELLALEIAFEQQHASLKDVRRHRVLAPYKVRQVARQCK
jgi:hypothetical protein